jgi:hypothetical protein
MNAWTLSALSAGSAFIVRSLAMSFKASTSLPGAATGIAARLIIDGISGAGGLQSSNRRNQFLFSTEITTTEQQARSGSPLLKEELHRYKRSLDLWTEQTSRKMVAFVNSFADAYRAQLSRVRRLSGGAEASPELAHDLARLLRWEPEKHADARQS